ncbi:uncharacterized protein LOC108000314 isoform X2 [Apis cerana]|nr:uncharacterized protein LOC108000314 isoform X2 [Apis cerana]
MSRKIMFPTICYIFHMSVPTLSKTKIWRSSIQWITGARLGRRTSSRRSIKFLITIHFQFSSSSKIGKKKRNNPPSHINTSTPYEFLLYLSILFTFEEKERKISREKKKPKVNNSGGSESIAERRERKREPVRGMGKKEREPGLYTCNNNTRYIDKRERLPRSRNTNGEPFAISVIINYRERGEGIVTIRRKG